jgi:hypothetical protein
LKPLSQRMCDLALKLIEHELRASVSKSGTRLGNSPLTPHSASDSNHDFAAIEKLRPHLVTLMSKLGFHALVLRARALSIPEAPWLSDLVINPDGSIGGLDKAVAGVELEAIIAGRHLLLARLLTLLEAFIGATLTMQLVSEVWPEVPLDDLDSDRGELIEKTN